MRLRSGTRKAVLSIHLVVSVGWIGAVTAYLALDVTTITSDDPDMLTAAYTGMNVIAGSVIVPLAIASLITGVVISAGTRWGLFRHYWVVISLLLTVLAVAVLLVETRTIGSLAEIATDPSTTPEELAALNSTLVHSIGGLLVLLAVLVLNVYKPRGMTRYGWREESQPSPTR
ncbi:MAG: DUF2269 domain-containing protein [Acidimicrobiia bacterium]